MRKRCKNGYKLRRVVGILVVMLLCITGKSVIKSKYNLNSITYILQSKKISEEICLIQITDLHNSIFGSDNKHLISKAAMKSPDLIMITGDLLNANEPDNHIAVTLLAELSAIAPTYISLGNHELEYEQNYGTDITALYESAGATVLNYEYKDITSPYVSAAFTVTVSRINIWKLAKRIQESVSSCGILRTPTVTKSCSAIFRLPG